MRILIRRRREVSEGSSRQRHLRPKKPGRLLLSHAGVRRAAERPGETRRSTGPKPATRRQARSCRRPDDRKAVRRRWKPRARVRGRKAVWRSDAGGFPTADGGQSPKEVFPAGARDVNVGCRNGFEASWRGDRGTLKGGPRARRTAKEKTTDLDETGGRSRRGKGAPGEQGPKGRREPLDQGVRQTSWPSIELRSRIRGRRVGSRYR